MVKKAAKYAVGIAVIAAFCGGVLPRIIFHDLPSETWPPAWKEATLYFSTGFIAAFSVLLLAFRIKEARSKDSSLKGVPREPRPIFESRLPANIDWEEVNAFLRATKFYKLLLLDDWRKSDAFAAFPISNASMACIACLHEDLGGCYKGSFAFDENGEEDRHEEYRLIRTNLQTKYEGLDDDIRDRIYVHYLQEDR